MVRLAYSKLKYSMHGLIKGSNNEFKTILCLVFNTVEIFSQNVPHLSNLENI